MSIKEMYQVLSNTGYPVAYRVFKTKQTLPFIVFYTDGTDNAFADNSVKQIINSWTVELYTDVKDPEAEAAVEAVLPVWNKSETYIDDEQMFEIIYTFEDIYNGEPSGTA